MRRRFTIVLEEEAEGGFHAFCPALPGCHSEGDSLDEALVNVREAIELYLESLAAHGEEIPPQGGVVLLTTEVEVGAAPAVSHG